VLILGESGSGKEVCARAIHDASPRRGKPFVAMNCGAIPGELLESELFGHERGAFTGAQQMRRGRFEQAEGGTLFLDEIGDMPADLQTRLLRVLSDGHFYRVGGHHPLKANVRVIAATHQNLDERVRQGLFREDLYHRLNVIRLRLPPLRERAQDVPLLARHFLARSARELGVEPKRLSDEALARLAAFPWMGNVRQLENVCHWLTVMAPAQTVDAKDLPPEFQSASPAGGAAVPGAAGPAPWGSAEGGAYAGGAPAPAPVAGADQRAAPGAPAPWGAQAGGLERPPLAPLGGAAPASGSVVAGPGVAAAGAAVGGDHAVGRPTGAPSSGTARDWPALLEAEVVRRLAAQSARGGEPPSDSQVMDELTRVFESAVIRTALRHTRGRRIDAALRLGIGRNTITRKIQELRLEDDEG
jgi:two-component system nitrogen regulation response regulator GlnG